MKKAKPVHKMDNVLARKSECGVFVLLHHYYTRYRITTTVSWGRTTCKNCLRCKSKSKKP